MIIKKTETVPALMRGDGLFKGFFYIVRKPRRLRPSAVLFVQQGAAHF